MELLHRTDLTGNQRKWLSDFVHRWDAMRALSDAGPVRQALPSGRSPEETFITARSSAVEITDEHGALIGRLPPYEVWMWDANRRCHRCTDSGDDLDDLADGYDVRPDRVFSIPSTKP
jgi:hypothetical protein